MVAGQPIRGLVGQRMSGRKGVRVSVNAVTDTTNSGSLTATVACTAVICLFGAGAGGSVGTAGSGGDAVYKLYHIVAGQTVSWTIGAAGAGNGTGSTPTPGGDTTATLPSGPAVLARGGDSASTNSGDYIAKGGAGGALGAAGGAGQDGGGSGGAPGSPGGGGGGSAGLASKVANLLGNNGAPAGSAATGVGAGGGAGIGGNGSAGGGGRAVIILVRATAQ